MDVPSPAAGTVEKCSSPSATRSPGTPIAELSGAEGGERPDLGPYLQMTDVRSISAPAPAATAAFRAADLGLP